MVIYLGKKYKHSAVYVKKVDFMTHHYNLNFKH